MTMSWVCMALLMSDLTRRLARFAVVVIRLGLSLLYVI